MPGHPEIVGEVLSAGVTSKLHDVLFPLLSTAVMMMVVVDTITVPDIGDCEIVIDPGTVQLSVAVMPKVVT